MADKSPAQKSSGPQWSPLWSLISPVDGTQHIVDYVDEQGRSLGDLKDQIYQTTDPETHGTLNHIFDTYQQGLPTSAPRPNMKEVLGSLAKRR